MSNLTELTAQIITARAAKKDMSTEEFQQEMQMVYNFLKGVEEGNVQPSPPTTPAEESKPQLTIKQAFKKDEVICMICNQGFKTLKRHLTVAHSLKPGAYRKQFGIPSTQSLAAKNYVESRRQMALDRGQGEILAKARAVRAAKKTKPVVAAAPVAPVVKTKAKVVKVKAQVPTKRVKAPGPAVKVKAAVPAKVQESKAPAKTKKPSTGKL